MTAEIALVDGSEIAVVRVEVTGAVAARGLVELAVGVKVQLMLALPSVILCAWGDGRVKSPVVEVLT